MHVNRITDIAIVDIFDQFNSNPQSVDLNSVQFILL